MGKALIAYNDIGLAALYSGGTWEGTLTPANQLTDRLITAKARTTSTAELVWDLTLAAGANLSYDMVSLVNHNLSSTATVRIQVYMDSARTTLESDSGTLSASATANTVVTPVFVHYITIPATRPYLRITVNDPDNPDGYFEFGRVHIATTWYPEFNVEYGAAVGWEDLSEIAESTTGIEFYDNRMKRRTVNLPYQILTNVEAAQAEAIIGNIGITGEIMFCFDDDVMYSDYSRTFLARMSKIKDIRMVDFNLNTVSISLQEVL
jgi:hypothetical protein